MEPQLERHCQPLLRILPLPSTLRCSRFCCVASTCLCLLSRAPADVAVFLTLFATIEQRAVKQECLGGEGLQCKFSVKLAHVLVPHVHNGRRLEIVAEGLLLCGGVQLVVDITQASPPRGHGSLRPNIATRDGGLFRLQGAARSARMPSWWGPRARARLVVWAGEVGGRWSGETLTCLRLLAEAKSRSEPPVASSSC